jgi:hypothetical protein
MRQLIEENISLASIQRTVPVIVEANGRRTADGGWTLYLASEELQDARWRYASPSRIARFYGNLAWKSTDAHLVASETNNSSSMIQGGQVRLLAPNGRYFVADRWTVPTNLYLRAFQ